LILIAAARIKVSALKLAKSDDSTMRKSGSELIIMKVTIPIPVFGGTGKILKHETLLARIQRKFRGTGKPERT